MNTVLLDAATDFAKGLAFTIPGAPAAEAAASTVTTLAMNPSVLIAAIALIAASIVIFFFMKKLIEHAIAGGIAWAIAVFVFHLQIPLVPSLVVSIIFGPAGLGAVLLLKFFGMI